MSVHSHDSLLDILYAATADSPLQILDAATQSVHKYEEMVKWQTKPEGKYTKAKLKISTRTGIN
jgi:hypothetical protein